MTTTAQKILVAFDSLNPGDKQEVAAEILRRSCPTGDMPPEAFDELAAAVFSDYDSEEAIGGAS